MIHEIGSPGPLTSRILSFSVKRLSLKRGRDANPPTTEPMSSLLVKSTLSRTEQSLG